MSLLLLAVTAHVVEADTPEEAEKFLEKNKDKESAIMFTTPKSTGIGNLFGLFSSDEYDSALDQKIADNVDLLKVDVTKDGFEDLQKKYGVDETPRLVVNDKGTPVLNEKPDDDTEDKVRDILKPRLEGNRKPVDTDPNDERKKDDDDKDKDKDKDKDDKKDNTPSQPSKVGHAGGPAKVPEQMRP